MGRWRIQEADQQIAKEANSANVLHKHVKRLAFRNMNLPRCSALPSQPLLAGNGRFQLSERTRLLS